MGQCDENVFVLTLFITLQLDDVAEKFHDKLMNGAMLLDKDWTPRDMEKNLSDPKDGMGIDNAQKRARVSAFIKALRETNIENRRARIRNYFNIWNDMDEVGDENEEVGPSEERSELVKPYLVMKTAHARTSVQDAPPP